jgi:hypothetical protein
MSRRSVLSLVALGGLAACLLIVYAALGNGAVSRAISAYAPSSSQASISITTPITPPPAAASEINPPTPAAQPGQEDGGSPAPTPTATAAAVEAAVTADTDTTAAAQATSDAGAPTPTADASAPGAGTPAPADWSFVSVRLGLDPTGNVLSLYGDMINNTGAPQAVSAISGVFYDETGQVVADEDHTGGFWPIPVAPPGAKVPFLMYVTDTQSAASFDLKVVAQPSDQAVRQDFDFPDAAQSTQNGKYCVAGKLHNTGGELQKYLVVALMLYDGQGRLLNFDYDVNANFPGLAGDASLPYSFCVDPLQQAVARYELRAWGQ